MLKNYFFQAWRRISKDKTYTLLNILGLAAGLTCFAFISLWVSDEMSYDKFNQNYDRIVRVKGTTRTETGITESAVSSAPMALALKSDYPEVESTVRVDMREEIVVHDNKQTLQPGILLTDPSFFQIFSYHLTKGDPKSALTEPYTIILTASAASHYFGNADPMGQRLTLFMHDSTNRGSDYKVTGVMPDPPQNAHFTFNMLVSFKTIEVAHPDVLTVDGWGDASYYTYLLLRKGVDQKTFSSKISQFYAKYIGDRYNAWRAIYSYSTQPLGDIHLRSHLQNEITANGNITQVYIFSIIGICILLLAGINYTNLSTARSAARAKEVGIKKLVGAVKKQLIWQYLSESVMLSLLALVVALLLSIYLQPFFFDLTAKNVSLFSSPSLLLFMMATSVFLGILSGIYPAFVLSAFKPATVLKGAFKTGSKGVALRKMLVVAQFMITVILVTGIVVIYSQMTYIKDKNLGYDKDALVYIAVNGNTDVINGYTAFQNDLISNPLINGITRSNSMIVNGLARGGASTIDAKGNPLQVNTSRLRVDTNYLRVYGLKLLAGNNFTTGSSINPIMPVILNATAVKNFGWKNAGAAIGKPFTMGDQHGTVIGVVSDFHYNSLQSEIEPLVIYPVSARFSKITLNIDISKVSESLALIERTWKKYFAGALFDFDFVDAQLARQYIAEQRFSKIFMYFSVIALLIACLGLYGLVAFTTSQKTKEIGIRKVLGASANGIAVLLSSSFLKLVIISCFVAIPLTWYIMHAWLQEFAYRINISWWMLALPVALVVFIALVTVTVHTIKAALVNPIKSLRTE
jgi:putative ABC transport system permease protein